MDEVVGGVDTGEGVDKRCRVEQVSAHHLGVGGDAGDERVRGARGAQTLRIPGEDAKWASGLFERPDEPPADIPGRAGQQNKPV